MTSTDVTSGRTARPAARAAASQADPLTIWREVADGFTDRLAAVGRADWSAPTCCEAWDVAALAGHVIDAQRAVPRALGASGAIDTTGDDLVRVWDAVRQAADAALSAPGALDQIVSLAAVGEMPAGNACAFLRGDLLVHTWDLARAIGASDRLHPGACALALAIMEPVDDLLRAPGFYGPKLEPAPGADVQDRLLAFLGRQV
jgi:uncharacterized protein (TIGR03086 family)